MALGVGAGAVSAGVFVGFLVNGPPQRALAPRTAAGEVAAPRPSGDTMVDAAPAVEAVRPIPPLPPVEAREAAPPQAPAPGPLVFAEVRELQRLLRAARFNPGSPPLPNPFLCGHGTLIRTYSTRASSRQ